MKIWHLELSNFLPSTLFNWHLSEVEIKPFSQGGRTPTVSCLSFLSQNAKRRKRWFYRFLKIILLHISTLSLPVDEPNTLRYVPITQKGFYTFIHFTHMYTSYLSFSHCHPLSRARGQANSEDRRRNKNMYIMYSIIQFIIYQFRLINNYIITTFTRKSTTNDDTDADDDVGGFLHHRRHHKMPSAKDERMNLWKIQSRCCIIHEFMSGDEKKKERRKHLFCIYWKIPKHLRKCYIPLP